MIVYTAGAARDVLLGVGVQLLLVERRGVHRVEELVQLPDADLDDGTADLVRHLASATDARLDR
jgi:hypothetical protein